MPHVDALSRYAVTCKNADEYHLAAIPAVQTEPTIPPSEQTSVIQWAQRQDAECQNIYKALRRGAKAHSHLAQYIKEGRFIIQDHLIYYKYEQREVPYVPATLRQRLLYEYHAGTCAAHLGSKKVLSALKRKYFWPSMKNDVFTYVHGCIPCLRRKGRPIHQDGRVPLPKGEPFQVVASDIFGPLPTTRRGSRYVLVFIDHFTKWPVLVPAAQVTAEHFVKYFHDYWITMFGCPNRLLTDGGPQFVADISRIFCEKYNINKTVSTAYHPQSNGIVEAFMKIIGHSLSILTKYRATEWDLYCSTIAFAYRTTIHPRTGNTPAYLAFGFDPKLPVDCDILESGYKTDTEARLQQLAVWRNLAKSRLQVEPDEQTATNYARIQPGMMVVYKLPPPEARDEATHKLQPRYSVPWRVVKQFDNSVTYEIYQPERGETKLINRDRLAVYTPNTGQYNLYEVQTPPKPLESPEPAGITTPPPPDATATDKPDPVVPTRQLRSTVERQSRVGDPMSWQYRASGVAHP